MGKVIKRWKDWAVPIGIMLAIVVVLFLVSGCAKVERVEHVDEHGAVWLCPVNHPGECLLLRPSPAMALPPPVVGTMV